MSAAELGLAYGLPWQVNARVSASSDSGALSLDGQQIVAARGNDPAAFEALVRRHQSALFNFAYRMLGQRDDAADVAQDTLIQLYSHLARIDEREPIAPWLFRVARNRCIDIIRRRRTVPLQPHTETIEDAIQLEPADQDPLPEEVVERADLQQLLAQAIAELPPAYAEIVALRYAGDRSFAEIAVILECDEGAARVRFHRAKALLRRYLRGQLAQTGGPSHA